MHLMSGWASYRMPSRYYRQSRTYLSVALVRVVDIIAGADLVSLKWLDTTVNAGHASSLMHVLVNPGLGWLLHSSSSSLRSQMSSNVCARAARVFPSLKSRTSETPWIPSALWRVHSGRWYKAMLSDYIVGVLCRKYLPSDALRTKEYFSIIVSFTLSLSYCVLAGILLSEGRM